MANHPRYAIYHAPAPGSDLDRFGAELLGYDAYEGIDLPFPDTVERSDWRDLTEDPRKYGFHATLKAPISLAAGKTEAELEAACKSFADAPRSLPRLKPVVDSISGFIAIVPAEPSVELQRLAADCVAAFDCFRAPLTPEDRERRSPSRLTERQREYLDIWGYPYVMEEFRFHMTLTGRLETARREQVLAMLRRSFSALKLQTLQVDRLALFRQDNAKARFRIIGHWPLRGEAG
jgi:putative phosphonate metabolism protein